MRSKTLGINVRVTAAEKEKLIENAFYCGLSMSEYLRRLGLGKNVKAATDEKIYKAFRVVRQLKKDCNSLERSEILYRINTMRFHDLRHSCASLLLANGVPLKHIQEWLGHSDFTTTANIYAHLDYSSKITSAQAMETGLALPESGDFGSRWEDGEAQI